MPLPFTKHEWHMVSHAICQSKEGNGEGIAHGTPSEAEPQLNSNSNLLEQKVTKETKGTETNDSSFSLLPSVQFLRLKTHV